MKNFKFKKLPLVVAVGCMFCTGTILAEDPYGYGAGLTIDRMEHGGDMDFGSDDGLGTYRDFRPVLTPEQKEYNESVGVIEAKAYSGPFMDVYQSFAKNVETVIDGGVTEVAFAALESDLIGIADAMLLSLSGRAVKELQNEGSLDLFRDLVKNTISGTFALSKEKLFERSKGVSKDIFIGMLKGIVIDSISDLAWKRTGERWVGGAVWIGLKHADIYLTSKTPLQLAYNEAALAGEVWVKTAKEAKIAYDDKNDAEAAAYREKVSYLHYEYLLKIPKASPGNRAVLYAELKSKFDELKDGYWFDSSIKKSNERSDQIDLDYEWVLFEIERFDKLNKTAILNDLIDRGLFDEAEEYLYTFFSESHYALYWGRMGIGVEAEMNSIEDEEIIYLNPPAVDDALEAKVAESSRRISTERKLELDRLLAKTDVDIFFLADNTGSMGGLIASAKENAQVILDSLRTDERFSDVNVQFGVGRYLGDPSESGESATSAYQLQQTITDDDTLITNAIDGWFASGGGDWEEANFFAIHQAITDGSSVPRNSDLKSEQVTGWRSGAEKVIVVFGDAPSWQNSVNEQELIQLVKTSGAKVVFIDTSQVNVGLVENVFDADTGRQMQDAAIEIADASGGSYMRLTDVNEIETAVLDSVFDAIADNQWTGGMIYADASEQWRVRTPSSVTATSSDDGDTLEFTLRFPNQADSTFTVDTTAVSPVVGTEYFEGTVTGSDNIFGENLTTAPRFQVNADKDFFRFLLNGTGAAAGYYGERIDSASKLPISGVASFDLMQTLNSTDTGGLNTYSDDMKMFINWATGKVYAIEMGAPIESVSGTSIFIGEVDRDQLELTGEYTFKTRRLTTSTATSTPRYVTDARRGTTTLQLFGANEVNGVGGTFGSTHYSEAGSPTLSDMQISGFSGDKNVTTGNEPSNGENWSGFASGLIVDRSTGVVDIALSDNASNVQITLHPDSSEILASVSVQDSSSTYSLVTNSGDESVYINKNAFAAVTEVSGVPAYVATTMTEDDNYDYQSWGVWSTEQGGITVVDGSHWVAGTLTPTVDMPTTGTATYSGQVHGVVHETSYGVRNLTGTANLTANFGANNISGSFDVNYSESGADFANPNLNGVSISGNQLSGGLSDTGATGSVNGAFFGPAAAEVGGNWSLNKDSGSKAAGVFSGKK